MFLILSELSIFRKLLAGIGKIEILSSINETETVFVFLYTEEPDS